MRNQSYSTSSLIHTCLIIAGVVASFATTPARADVGDELFKLSGTAGEDFASGVGIDGNIAIVGGYWFEDDSRYGSVYLFDVTTGEELFKLIPSDSTSGDYFGGQGGVAISGNRALVGASGSGSAYLFDVITGAELFKLTASDAAVGHRFGRGVAISGNVAIVGAIGRPDSADAGAAYLFDVNTGEELFKLTASDAAPGDEFGNSVDISGNVAIVAAVGDDDACPRDNGCKSGSAYLFDVNSGEELFKLTASDAANFDRFGGSVGISGDVAIVGADWDDDHGSTSGSAYLFGVTTGKELMKLTASDAAGDPSGYIYGDHFGWSVGISGSTAIVTSPMNDNYAAYLFDTETGEELAKITSSPVARGFGGSAAISDSIAIVGAIDSDAAFLFDVSRVPEPSSSILLFFALAVLHRNRFRWTSCRYPTAAGP